MLEALKWVQKYIHHFGGDPTRVTIAGQSAGAAAVTHLLVSPLGEGLFHQAIAGSGAASLEWATAADPLPHAMRVAELAGCANATVTDKAEIVLCMQQVPHQTLLEAMSNYTVRNKRKKKVSLFCQNWAFWLNPDSDCRQKSNSMAVSGMRVRVLQSKKEICQFQKFLRRIHWKPCWRNDKRIFH